MTLTLSVLRCPDAAPPETRSLEGGEFRIGRGHDNDWVLTDPERVLSKRHCVIAWRGGGWQIADTSTNGTFINQDSEPLGAGRVHAIEDGDRIRLGSYEIEARVAAAPGAGYGDFGSPASRSGGFDDPFGDDPFAPPPAASAPPATNDWLGGGSSISMPEDFSGLSDDDSLFGARPPVADHMPAQHDAFRPAPMVPNLLPDDWDLGIEPGGAARQGPSPSPAPLPPAPPSDADSLLPDDWDLGAGPDGGPAAASPSPSPAQPPASAMPPPPATPFDETPPPVTPFDEAPPAAAVPPPQQATPAPAPPPLAAPVAAPTGTAPTGDLLGVLLAAAGMTDLPAPDDPEALMRRLGAVFRALVSGLRQVMIARAAIKGEFRIEQTMIRARGNNPLKFSADDDDAMAALLGLGRRTGNMPAEDAVSDALRDIRLHEIAVMSAMQEAVRAMLARLDPAPLRAEAEAARAVLPAQRKARAFDAYEALYGEVSRALADDFDSVFGKTFARAYERALSDAEASER